MTIDAAALHARVAELALALPEASEKLSHGSASFQVAGKKMFAYFLHDHHGDGITSVCVKTSGLEEQAMLIEADPDIYYRPAYIGHKGWVGLRLDQGEPDWDQVAHRLALSWNLAAPKKLAAIMGF
jgi:hypothetical protein